MSQFLQLSLPPRGFPVCPSVTPAVVARGPWSCWKLFFLIFLAVFQGCNRNPGAPSGADSAANSAELGNLPDTAKSIRAVVTVGMVADLVRRIGDNAVEVTQIMGAGVDPHLYKATTDDVRQIQAADIVFCSGLMLEGRLIDTLTKIQRTQRIVAVTDSIPKDQLLVPDGAGGHFDPHVWMDVSAWASCTDVIAEQLAQLRPEKRDEFLTRADSLKADLALLHEYGRSSIASIPPDRRILITSHDAFNYFGRAYGLDVIGIQGLSTESEAGLQRINELVDLLVSRKIAAVFVESSVPRKNITALMDGAASRGHTVIIGGELFSDAMGQTGTYEGTYVGMLDHNMTLVTRGLGGEAPVRGLNERLAEPHGGDSPQ